MFGIDIIDASLLPAMFVALFAGVISFLSPCVLPIVPPYLAFMSGVSIAEMEAGGRARLRAFTAALFFVLGLSTVFVLLVILFQTLLTRTRWGRSVYAVGGNVEAARRSAGHGADRRGLDARGPAVY